ncbi:streptogrisin-B [Streptomyces albus]|uniref:Streptogrisin-B n=1 Tax=Streptomyces albus (strain ATCC 21838 / DSM 41398 / FERM P-419 / JCM 4703 / NBRC 107858) TaxID=1081613 RepID=A0A0B5ERQ7_STRA4|nr:streptogrisin-B [Streptomyces albus]AOU76287.1 streptogrisin-B [Streptomyces albus]AYN32073.1 S1 family peptidase [Streptomyces albus]
MKLRRSSSPRRSRTLRRQALAAAGLLTAAFFLTPGTGASAAQEPTGAAAAHAAEAVLDADVPGTAWSLDPATGTLALTADSTVDAAELARLKRATAPYAQAVSLDRVDGTLRPHVSGGSSVYGAGARCTAGFNVHNGSDYYFLTAGHCTEAAQDWYADPALTVYIGSTAGSSFPGNDYGLVRYQNPAVPHPSDVRNATGVVTQITGAGQATVGQQVCTTNDRTTGVHCGTVTGLNATVNYGNGQVVSGLAQTTLCSEPGSSGSPVFSGTIALGLISGGSGNCTSGGTSFYQPVPEVLSAYGLTI